MPCPNPACRADDSYVKKQGSTYRKPEESEEVKVRQYQCTKCGYKGRGNKFGLPEEVEDDT